MVNPIPDPLFLFLPPLSTCTNSLNSSGNVFSGIPIPVSFTTNSITAFGFLNALTDTFNPTSPSSVNLTALLSRLLSTCFNLRGSPIQVVGILGSISIFQSNPFSFAFFSHPDTA